jgi:hypothetical protein
MVLGVSPLIVDLLSGCPIAWTEHLRYYEPGDLHCQFQENEAADLATVEHRVQ